MGYSDYLKQTLKPLQVYDLNGGIVSDELSVCGAAMDGIFDALCGIEAEMLPLTASDTGLSMYESILPYAPAAASAEDRRAAIAALMLVDRDSVSIRKLNRTLCGCGIPASVSETGISQVVAVSFPQSQSAPQSIAKLKARIGELLPCHLTALYETDYITWSELEGEGFIWSRFASEGLDWIHLLIYGD